MVIQDAVNEVFHRLAAGDLPEPISPMQEGWEADLPSGRTVARSTLQEAAGVLVALGPHAVPHLLSWVLNDNAALRYVAIYTLEQITGEKSYFSYFDQDDPGGRRRAHAIETWRRWYEARK